MLSLMPDIEIDYWLNLMFIERDDGYQVHDLSYGHLKILTSAIHLFQ